MSAQQHVAFDWSLRQVNRELDVILDSPDPDMSNLMIGRSHADSPEIDAVVRVKGKNLRAGDIVRVKVTAADGYDLAAKAIGSAR
jgi:ribosomal protein S12 methylthiotransferase